MQILKVAGYHRVGKFAKERIEAHVEFFNDYGQAHDEAPGWILKPDDPKEGPSTPQGREKKGPLHRSLVEHTLTIQ